MRQADVKNPGSKPVKWADDKPHIAYLLALLGASEKQMAEVMGVSYSTLEVWKRNKPEFQEALKKGKLKADTKVVKSFYKCAVGYYYTEEEIRIVDKKPVVVTVRKYKPPDPWSAAKWLALRHPEHWSETHKVQVTNTNININKIDLTGVTIEQMKVLRDLGFKQRELMSREDNDEKYDNIEE